MDVNVFTIGFTKKSARKFFSTLADASVKRVVDVRLNNVSQLAGFTKRDDLAFFLEKVCGIEYVHLPLLAPTQDMLSAYRGGREGWDVYEKQFLDLMAARQIEREIEPKLLADACLLCSEEKAHHCHRRLVAEYLKERWENLTISHLV